MLILNKTVFAVMIGFIVSGIFGYFMVPLLKKLKAGTRVSKYVRDMHGSKDGTPRMGGLIFIIGTIISLAILWLMGMIDFSSNLFIILMVFVGYAIIGFIDDVLVVRGKTNTKKGNLGLTEMQKLIGQLVIAVIFFYIFMSSGGEPIIWVYTLGIKIHVGWIYGFFILFMLVGCSNAVNITDGLDGLAGGLSVIAFVAFGLIAWGTGWLEGYKDIALFCFVLVGSLLGFLIYNSNPAKVFMGDTGSLALGAVLATIAILTRHELTLIIVGGVFIIETLTSIIQIISIKYFKRKIFLMAPVHHHFEKLGWKERDIVKMFWIVGFVLAMMSIAFGVWI